MGSDLFVKGGSDTFGGMGRPEWLVSGSLFTRNGWVEQCASGAVGEGVVSAGAHFA